MPENHDHSKYIAVESHYEGHRRDINDLDLKAYIDERIANSGGSSSYLVYTALLSQSGANAPSDENSGNGFQNTLGGAVIWSRDSLGVYFGQTNIPNGNINRIYIAYSMGSVGGNFVFIPISDYAAITGYITINVIEGVSNLMMTLETFNATFTPIEFSTLFTGGKLRLPELKYFPV